MHFPSSRIPCIISILQSLFVVFKKLGFKGEFVAGGLYYGIFRSVVDLFIKAEILQNFVDWVLTWNGSENVDLVYRSACSIFTICFSGFFLIPKAEIL